MSYQISRPTRHRVVTGTDSTLPTDKEVGFVARNATSVLLYLSATGGTAKVKVAWWDDVLEKYFYGVDQEIEAPAAGDYVAEVTPLGTVGYVFVETLAGSKLDVRTAITRGV